MEAFLFGNNPHKSRWNGYDVLAESQPTNFSVYHHRDVIGPGDIGAVYQFDGKGGGAIVAVVRILGKANGHYPNCFVPWELRPLTRQEQISRARLARSKAWFDRKPVVSNSQFASPIKLDPDRWSAIEKRLSLGTQRWLHHQERHEAYTPAGPRPQRRA